MNSDTGKAASAGLLTPLKNFFAGIYRLHVFMMQFFKQLFLPPYEWREVVNQCYEIGCKTLPLISLTGFITGLVFTKQSRPSLSEFGAASWLPSLVTIAIVRALAPLVTSLILAGKVGSNIGAELGSMRVSEQIDAMEMTATNPFKFLVVTRILACTLMAPLLVMYSGCIGIFGAYLNVHTNELTSFRTFLHDAFSKISFLDLYSSFIKSAVYGFTVGVISCFKGYNAANGTVGVGKAANQAVVISMFAIFLEETVIVQFVNSFLR
ncbi:MAG TPA: ABC transporter permease [Chitinophagaceae bacterium]|nr:ABC transporter permease [Chitinophagaceae bacterium]